MPESIPVLKKRQQPGRKRIDTDILATFALVAATVIALVWANISSTYTEFWSTEAGFSLGDFHLMMSLEHWVNDGLITIFFFHVGLEVKKEVSIGELRQKERAIMAVLAAIGGIAIPAFIFLAFTVGTPSMVAWGAVISTDTAFVLGMLALVGPKNTPRLKVFLLTVAVVDDIAALSVIAIFYTDDLQFFPFIGVIVGLFLIWLLERANVWRITPYLLIGLATWVAMYFTGVHATLAGVLIALLIPVYTTRTHDVDVASRVVRMFRQAPEPRAARIARRSIDWSVSLNQRLSDLLPPYVNFIIVPLFALANAGIVLSQDMLEQAVTSPLTWGIIAGLGLGKLIGITSATMLVRRFVPSSRAPGLDFPRVSGISALSGMGFTISLLVVELAFPNGQIKNEARVGVLAASLLALILAWLIFAIGNRLKPLPKPKGLLLQRSIDRTRDHVRGPATARSNIVVYSSIGNTYRSRTIEALAEVRANLGDDLTIVFRHHTTSDDDMTRALLLEAASAQGKFWEMHDVIVSVTGDINDDDIDRLIDETGIDRDRCLHDMNTGAQLSRVDDDNLDATAAGLPEYPVLYLNGRRLKGPANSWYITNALRNQVSR